MGSSHSSARTQLRVFSVDMTEEPYGESNVHEFREMNPDTTPLPLKVTASCHAEGPMSLPVGRVLKRALDLVVAIPVVLLVVPFLCVFVKLAQLLQSRGPLFYTQARCGRDGKEFTILKFRTMNVPKEGQCEIEDDPGSRIYPLGTLLRRSKLDEIPQFINVLLGSMSVVGPRPHHAADCATFASRVAEYPERFVAKPGITGLAQFAEYRGDFEWNCVESRVEKDLRYIREWSILMDIRLIIKTVDIVGRRVASGILRRLGVAVRNPQTERPELAVYKGEAENRPDVDATDSNKRAA